MLWLYFKAVVWAYGPVVLLPRQSSEHGGMTVFCRPARDTLLSNRNTEKLNFDINYITKCCFKPHKKNKMSGIPWNYYSKALDSTKT